MSTLVTIFKKELTDKEDVIDALRKFSVEVRELQHAFVFAVKPGMLIPFLHLLNQHHVNYGTHFGDDQHPPNPSSELSSL